MKRRLLLNSNSTMHGGKYLDHCEDDIKDLFLGRRRILFVPFALHDRAKYVHKVRERFADFGLEVESLHDRPDAQAAVGSAEGMFIGGGNTWRLLTSLYELNVLSAIRSRVGEGMPYMGSSAGTGVACVTIKTTNDMPIVQPPSFSALGLVPFNINAHYRDPDPGSTHMGETREERIREFHEMNDPPVLGMREGAWLRVDDSSAILKGTTGARLFRKGREPEEYCHGARLDFLLKEEGDRKGEEPSTVHE